MTVQIKIEHLRFVEEAREAFQSNPLFHTFRNEDDTLIALRMGEDRDCVDVYELGRGVANFVQQIEPCLNPRKEVMKFAHEMEECLKANDHKYGWEKEHWCDLVSSLERNTDKLRTELIKPLDKRDGFDISILCANIANFAMMIAENNGNPL